MSGAALAFMIASVSFVVLLAGWCYYKILMSSRDKQHSIRRDRMDEKPGDPHF